MAEQFLDRNRIELIEAFELLGVNSAGNEQAIDAKAMSAGQIQAIDPALAQEAHDYRLKQRAIGATFFYYSRRVLRADRSVI